MEKISAKLVKELREASSAGIMDCKRALIECKGNIKDAMKWLREKGISKAIKKNSKIATEGIVKIISNKNVYSIFEVNSETDFVAKNDKFLKLIDIIGNVLISNPEIKTTKEILNLKVNGVLLQDKIIEAISIIGEKISLRRFKTIALKDNQSIGFYVHNGKSASLLLFEGNISLNDGKQLAMHVTAMSPKFISRNYMSEEYINTEKEILTKKALLEGKPKNIVEKMVIGRLNKVLSEVSFLDQNFVIDPNIKINNFIKSKNVKLLDMIRFEVGEGIEKNQEDFATEVMKQIKK